MPSGGGFIMGNTGNLEIDWRTTTLGVGYRSYMFETVHNTALDGAENTTSEKVHAGGGVSKGPSVDFDCRTCTSYQDLTRRLSVSAQAEGAVLGAQVAGSASLLYDTEDVSN